MINDSDQTDRCIDADLWLTASRNATSTLGGLHISLLKRSKPLHSAGISSACGDQIPAVGCRQRAAALARWPWRSMLSMAMMEASPRPLP
jgi:hypothetical protein